MSFFFANSVLKTFTHLLFYIFQLQAFKVDSDHSIFSNLFKFLHIQMGFYIAIRFALSIDMRLQISRIVFVVCTNRRVLFV